MTLCRTNLVAVLTIVAGGTIGGLLTLGSLLLSRPGDVLTPSQLVAPSAAAVCGKDEAADPLHQRVACAEARYLAARENDDWVEEAQLRLERDRMAWRRENPTRAVVLSISPDGQWMAVGDITVVRVQPITYVIY